MKECWEIFHQKKISRRKFLLGSAGILSTSLLQKCSYSRYISQTFITTAKDYSIDIKSRFLLGLKELKVNPEEIKGKRILLKPNLVEPHQGANQINTHPLVIRGAIEVFYSLGAKKVLVGEGAGHMRDTLLVLEESGVAAVLSEDKVPFVDLNNDAGFTVENQGGKSRLKQLTLPETLRQVDWIVSLAKMKTHHWAGVTLSMKNMFGVMPGIFYGFPKNVLHRAGIDEAILDINMTVKPHFAIIDGIVGMEGDGPIMGMPKPVGVLVMGRNLPAVDATCARIMGIDPYRVRYLAEAWRLGPISERDIVQLGENPASVRTDFKLLEKIPAHRNLRL
jgi:uncharacterized protein (DUF362 family)